MREQLIENLPDASETTEELQEAGEAVSERIEDAASDNNDGSGSGLNLLQDEGGNCPCRRGQPALDLAGIFPDTKGGAQPCRHTYSRGQQSASFQLWQGVKTSC